MSINNEVAYYFGRLNLITIISKDEKSKYLYNSLVSGVKVRRKGSAWGFFNTEIIDYRDEVYFFGILVKYKGEDETEIADEKTNTLKKKTVISKTIDKFQFILHPRTGLISYHATGGISKKSLLEISFVN